MHSTSIALTPVLALILPENHPHPHPGARQPTVLQLSDVQHQVQLLPSRRAPVKATR